MASEQRSSQDSQRPKIEQIDHIALVVNSMETSLAWYLDMFGFENLGSSPNSNVIYLGNADTRLAILPASDESPFIPPVNQGARACHFAFRADGAAYVGYRDRLDQRGVSYDTLTHSDSQSIYFSDPDGYMIEITTYDDV